MTSISQPDVTVTKMRYDTYPNDATWVVKMPNAGALVDRLAQVNWHSRGGYSCTAHGGSDCDHIQAVAIHEAQRELAEAQYTGSDGDVERAIEKLGAVMGNASRDQGGSISDAPGWEDLRYETPCGQCHGTGVHGKGVTDRGQAYDLPCPECEGLGWQLTPLGEKIMRMVNRRLIR